MKFTLYFILLLCTTLSAQQKSKDTLFFKLDRYINISKHNPNEIIFNHKEFYYKDQGVLFEKKGVLTNLSPNKVLRMKPFIRKARFYKKRGFKKVAVSDVFNYFAEKFVVFFVDKSNKGKKQYIEVSIVQWIS